jgi:hypothetical protein
MINMPNTIRYKFSQKFAVSPKQAYLWCTDFSPHDPQLLGYSIIKRKVTHLSEGLILLKDISNTSQGEVEKQKLVHLYPWKLSWTLTHITGPTKHSQFCYEIIEDANGCHLNYEALHIEHRKDNMAFNETLQLATAFRNKDSEMWRLLALAMEQELNSSI